VIYLHNAKCFQTFSGEKWRYFAKSLCSMLKLRSTAHEVAWQFNNFKFGLHYSSGLMFVWPGHFYNCFQVINQFESVIKENRTILKWLSTMFFKSHFYILCNKAYLMKVACEKGKSCNIKFLQPAHRTT